MKHAFNSRAWCRGAVASFLLLLASLPAISQERSFYAAKKEFDKAIDSKDPAAQKRALESIAEIGKPDTVKLLVETLLELRRAGDSLYSEFTQAGLRRAELKAEIRTAEAQVRGGKIHQDVVTRLTAELADVEKSIDPVSKRIDRHEEVMSVARRAVGWAFQRCNDPHRINSASWLSRHFSRLKTVEDQAELVRAMVWIDRDEMTSAMNEQFKKGLPAVRVAVLNAWADRGGSKAIAPALLALSDKAWPVQAAAVGLLRKVGGKHAFAALIDVLATAEGRLQTDAQEALKALSGQNFHDNQHLWKEWLAKSSDLIDEPTEDSNAAPTLGRKSAGRGGRGPGEAAKQGGTGFYGIETKSKHIIYVIDYSGSMDSPLKGNPPQNGNQPTSMERPKIGGPRKVDGVATELIKSVNALPSDATFTIVLFNHEVTVWQPKMMKADQNTKKAARAWVLNQPPGGSTNFFGGLEKAFGMTGRGTFDKHYGLAADTIIMLSDGSPTEGRIQDPDLILREVRKLNELSRVAVHCVGLGRAINVSLLERLAAQNDGDFAHVF